MKNILDASTGAVSFYLFGYAVSACARSRGSGTSFIGGCRSSLALQGSEWEVYSDDSDVLLAPNWIFLWAFKSTASTIVSGAVSERISKWAYTLSTLLLQLFIYPTVAFAVWSSSGWLSAYDANNITATSAIDIAGSAVVHMVGGCVALMGAIFVGPRIGRFDEETGKARTIPGHSAYMSSVGTLLLWLAWIPFNSASSGPLLSVNDDGSLSTLYAGFIGKSAVNTSIAAGAGGVCGIVLNITLLQKKADVSQLQNGILAGLVAITASSQLVPAWAALIIGIIGCGAMYLSEIGLEKLKIDDPVSAVPVHLFAGIVGILAVVPFATDNALKGFFGDAIHPARSASLLGAQLTLLGFVVGWSCIISAVLFWTMRRLNILRVSSNAEKSGMDLVLHGSSAYSIAKGILRDRESNPWLEDHGTSMDGYAYSESPGASTIDLTHPTSSTSFPGAAVGSKVFDADMGAKNQREEHLRHREDDGDVVDDNVGYDELKHREEAASTADTNEHPSIPGSV